MLGFRKDRKDAGADVDPAQPAPAPGASEDAAARVVDPSLPKSAGKRLGEMLIDEGLINQQQLEEALAAQKENGGFIGQILLEMGYVRQDAVVSCLVRQCKIPHLSLLDYEISKDVLQVIPKELCLRYNLLPIDKLGRILTVAMVNPFDTEALEQIRRTCPELRIKPILCDWEHFRAVTARVFGEVPDGGTEVLDEGTLNLGPKRIAAPKSEPAIPKPPPETESVRNAMNAVVGDILRDAEVNALATATRPSRPAPSADLSAVARESVGGAMQEAMAHLIVESRANDSGFQSPPPPLSAQDLAEALRTSVSGAMQEAVAALAVRLRAETGRASAASAPGSELAEVVRTTVREALRESETAAVARANLREMESRDAEQARRSKHASVTSFDAARQRRAYQEAVSAVANPERRQESDEDVMAAMNSDRLVEQFTFDRFIVGDTNAFTCRLCERVAAQPGGEYNPFFLYGDVGLGKTHLLNAIGNAVRASLPDQRVGYVSASRFASRLTEALREGAGDAFRANYCHWDVVILDDIQFLGGRVEAQEEFFHIFNGLQQAGRQIIIAGDKAPDRLGLLEQRLVSRFASGIVATVRPPEWETRMVILRHQAAQASVEVNDEVLSLIAMRVSTDVRKMIGALRKMIAYAQLVGGTLSCELAQDILSHLNLEEAA